MKQDAWDIWGLAFVFAIFAGIALTILHFLPQHEWKVCALEKGSLTAVTTDCATGSVSWSGSCVEVWPENTNEELFYCDGVYLNQVK